MRKSFKSIIYLNLVNDKVNLENVAWYDLIYGNFADSKLLIRFLPSELQYTDTKQRCRLSNAMFGLLFKNFLRLT